MAETSRLGGGMARYGIPALAAFWGALHLLALAGAPKAASAYDADLWAEILAEHTRPVEDVAGTRVDYAALRDSADLRALVSSLEQSDPEALRTTEEKLAFWVNAYNIFAIDLVARHYPVEGIKEIGSWLRPVWKIEVGRVGGRGQSLDAIEHRILRPLGDPRIHGAVVCASTSCPPLRREPYRAERLDLQLDDNVSRWLADARKGLRIDEERKRVHLSRIFDWFAEDFESAGGALGFAAEYVSETERRWIERYGAEAEIVWLDYDWSLNDLARLGLEPFRKSAGHWASAPHPAVVRRPTAR